MIERVYTLNLRKETIKKPRYKRTARVAKLIKDEVAKHMKSDNVKLEQSLNELIWEHGDTYPQLKYKVRCVKDDKGEVKVSLVKE